MPLRLLPLRLVLLALALAGCESRTCPPSPGGEETSGVRVVEEWVPTGADGGAELMFVVRQHGATPARIGIRHGRPCWVLADRMGNVSGESACVDLASVDGYVRAGRKAAGR